MKGYASLRGGIVYVLITHLRLHILTINVIIEIVCAVLSQRSLKNRIIKKIISFFYGLLDEDQDFKISRFQDRLSRRMSKKCRAKEM